MNIVYVLTSSLNDFYLEQALCSMYSVKLHNSQSVIFVVSDYETEELIKKSNHPILKYIDRIVPVDCPAEMTKMQKSRFIKTSLRKYVSGDFLFLDCDTIVLRSLDKIAIKCKANIGAVRHAHQKNVMHRSVKNYLKTTDKIYWGSQLYYNSGVMFIKDTVNAHLFYEQWHKLWLEEFFKFGISIDQPSLSQIENKYPAYISELSGHFNCQIETRNGKKYMFNPFIFHYFSEAKESTFFPLKNKEVLKKIRSQGIDEDIKEIIQNPQYYYSHRELSKKRNNYIDILVGKMSCLLGKLKMINE